MQENAYIIISFTCKHFVSASISSNSLHTYGNKYHCFIVAISYHVRDDHLQGGVLVHCMGWFAWVWFIRCMYHLEQHGSIHLHTCVYQLNRAWQNAEMIYMNLQLRRQIWTYRIMNNCNNIMLPQTHKLKWYQN